MNKISTLLLLAVFATSSVFAQHDMKGPRVSPKASSSYGNVSVSYSQPAKKGRIIFGGLVPYGKVWRTGANEATEITFKKNAKFGGNPIKAGTYTLFTIPNEGKWEIILNSELKQWGAFGYDKIKDKDVLHVTVPSKKLNNEVERFTMTVKKDGLLMEWDKTSVWVPIKD